jgi:hypothetical protein
MLSDDTRAAAEPSTRIIDDLRVRHFHDPERRSGKAIAKSLGSEDAIAWDTYLFYASGSEWTDGPPAPIDWMHQLPSSWADPARFHTGDDLVEELHKAMKRLTGAQP